MLPHGECKLPILTEEVVLTEKLDGGNCSIHCGKVGLITFDRCSLVCDHMHIYI